MNLFTDGSMYGEYNPTFDPNHSPLTSETLDRSVVIVNAFGFRYNDQGEKIPGRLMKLLRNMQRDISLVCLYSLAQTQQKHSVHLQKKY